MSKDHHKNSFDEGTLTKLDIFQAYAEAWLGIFSVTKMKVKNVWIWDFFAGPGTSVSGQPGSPLRILAVIEGHVHRIISKGLKVHVRFNEKSKIKYNLLIQNVESYVSDSVCLSELKKGGILDIQYYNSDFGPLFKKIIPALGSEPALMFLDQNGVKYLGDEYLLPLLKSRFTDFLYFVSASYFVRFSSMPEFAKNVPFKLNPEKPYNFIHREVIGYVRSKIPNKSKMRVYPFSIKKGSNIYGLIFGASHILAAEKFLTIAWDKNQLNGEANFDIDDDEISGIEWVIVGGESGPNARRMLPKWVNSIKEQTSKYHVPFFFKQWGTWGPDGVRRSKKANGELFEGVVMQEMPK